MAGRVLDAKQTVAVKALRHQRAKRGDSWYNSRNRMGSSADPVISTNYLRTRSRLKREDAEVLYEMNWLAARGVDQLGNDATREWIRFSHKTNPETAEKLREEDARLNGRGLFEEGIRWSRLHGGNLLVIGAWDGADPSKELHIDRVKKMMFATNVDRWLSYPRDWYRDPDTDKYGQPEVYQIHRLSPIGTAGSRPVPSSSGFPEGGTGEGRSGGPVAMVHESRTIRFDGDPLPAVAKIRNWGWGASILDKVYDELRNWGVSQQAASSIIPTFITKKMKIGNLAELIQQDDWATIKARLGEVFASMAVHNLVFYGADEEIENMGTPITGLPELMGKFEDVVSAAFDIAKSILFHAESGALGGSAADADLRNQHAKTHAYQENYLRPRIRRWLDIIGVPLGIKPGEVEFEFKPLWQLTGKEEAEIYYQNAQADQIAVTTGMVDSAEALGIYRFGGKVYNAASPVIDTERMQKIVDEINKQPIELGMGDSHGVPNQEQEGEGEGEGGEQEGEEQDFDRKDVEAVRRPDEVIRVDDGLLARVGTKWLHIDAPVVGPVSPIVETHEPTKGE